MRRYDPALFSFVVGGCDFDDGCGVLDGDCLVGAECDVVGTNNGRKKKSYKMFVPT